MESGAVSVDRVAWLAGWGKMAGIWIYILGPLLIGGPLGAVFLYEIHTIVFGNVLDKKQMNRIVIVSPQSRQ